MGESRRISENLGASTHPGVHMCVCSYRRGGEGERERREGSVILRKLFIISSIIVLFIYFFLFFFASESRSIIATSSLQNLYNIKLIWVGRDPGHLEKAQFIFPSPKWERISNRGNKNQIKSDSISRIGCNGFISIDSQLAHDFLIDSFQHFFFVYRNTFLNFFHLACLHLCFEPIEPGSTIANDFL